MQVHTASRNGGVVPAKQIVLQGRDSNSALHSSQRRRSNCRSVFLLAEGGANAQLAHTIESISDVERAADQPISVLGNQRVSLIVISAAIARESSGRYKPVQVFTKWT